MLNTNIDKDMYAHVHVQSFEVTFLYELLSWTRNSEREWEGEKGYQNRIMPSTLFYHSI